MDVITQFLMAAAGSPWVYVVLAIVCIVDAFFPPVPSETIVVGLATLAVSTGSPWLWLVVVVAAAGAIIGDNIAYAIGRSIGTTRFAWMRRPRVAAAFEWARRGVHKRPASLILTGRYIPVGRIAVNMTAGATGFPWKRFVSLSMLAGASWALYSIAIGTLVGQWFPGNPILAVVIAVACALVIGVRVDPITQRIQSRGQSRAAAATDPAPGLAA
jgi:membrane protein DedA with SNARE-associated domain